MTIDRDLLRRSGGVTNVGNFNGHNIQLDIERLFSQRVFVYEKNVASKICEDFVVNAIFKVFLFNNFFTNFFFIFFLF
jgi:hypothetical protein